MLEGWSQPPDLAAVLHTLTEHCPVVCVFCVAFPFRALFPQAVMRGDILGVILQRFEI